MTDFAPPLKKLAESGIGVAVNPTGSLGLALSPDGYIPTGLVRSDSILDGTIATADLADGSVTSAKILDGTIVNADLSGGYPQLTDSQAACNSTLTLTTSAQDIPGCSVSLPLGSYFAVGVFDFSHSANGGGTAVGTLVVGASTQAAEAHLLNTGSANGDRATVAQIWLFTVLGSMGPPVTVKLQANKTINAGTSQALINHTTLTYLRVA